MPAETLGASLEGTLVIEQFLMANYRFRRNILNGKVEFAVLPKADNKAEGNAVETIDSLSGASINEADLEFRPLTQAALNSIVIRAKREQVLEKGSPKAEITEYVTSEEVPEHNPVQAFLKSLPVWTDKTILPGFRAQGALPCGLLQSGTTEGCMSRTGGMTGEIWEGLETSLPCSNSFVQRHFQRFRER